MNQCLCASGPAIIQDEVAGEALCSACGTVVYEREASDMWDCEDKLATPRGMMEVGSNDVKFAMVRWGRSDAVLGRHAELTRLLAPVLKHVSASSIMIDETNSLLRRIIHNEFAKGKTKLTLCVGLVLAVCRIHGRVVTCNELAELTGTNVKKIRRMSTDIMVRYNMKPLSIQDRTKRIISRMCADIGRPDLLRPALDTYCTMARRGHTAGKNPHNVAASALGRHTDSIMSKEQFFKVVGVHRHNISRYTAKHDKAAKTNEQLAKVVEIRRHGSVAGHNNVC